MMQPPLAARVGSWVLLLALGLLPGIGRAQEPTRQEPPAEAEAPQPAITLLLQAPRTLAAETFRKRLARVLRTEVAAAATTAGAFVSADGDALVGGRDGITWRLEAKATPCELPASAVEHLDDEDREVVTGHRAHLRVLATSACADDGARVNAYRVLAGVSAALLGRDVRGLGAAAFGTFEAFGGDEAELREELLGEDPLEVLTPTTRSSLVLFVATERTVDEADLRARLGKEFGTPFGTRDDDNDERFVAVLEGGVFVKVDDELVLVEFAAGQPSSAEDLQKYDDLRVRRVLGDHRQLLRLQMYGAVGKDAEDARRRLLGKVAAALWGDDVLGLSWHCDRRIVPGGPEVQAQLRTDFPVVATLGDSVVPVLAPTDAAAMDAAMAKARETWPEALAHFRKGGELSVKFPFATRTGGKEHIWINVQSVDGDVVHGVLANDPLDIPDRKLGSKVECKLTELSDWLFLRDGAMVGGYTVKVLQQQAERQRPPVGGKKEPSGGK